MKKRLFTGIISIILIFMSVGTVKVNASGESSVQGWSPYEDEVVYDRRPTLSWLIAPNGSSVTSFEMTLDGVKVDARYNEAAQLIEYKLTQDLSLGKHTLYASVSFDDGNTYEISPVSSFTIAKSPAELTGFDPFLKRDKALLQKNEAAEIAVVNKLRKSLGLPPVERHESLSLAAQAHSNYLEMNRLLDHYQVKGKPGFIGVGPSDRAGYFGYQAGVAEDASSDPVVYSALQGLIDAPYHRLPFMDPNVALIGIGHSDEATVINFGFGNGSDRLYVAMYPYPGQTDVSPYWHDTEIPSPLKEFGEQGSVVGYPIMLSLSGASSISIHSAKITDQRGQAVPFYHVDANEKNSYVLLIPKNPLRDGESYTVHINGTYTQEDSNKALNKKWMFTTESYDGKIAAPKTSNMKIQINGKQLALKQPPVVINGSSFLPLRTILESLGASIKWDGSTQIVSASRPGTEIVLQIGSYVASVNGQETLLDQAPQLVNGSSMIPLRFVSESFGATVKWNQRSNTAEISM